MADFMVKLAAAGAHLLQFVESVTDSWLDSVLFTQETGSAFLASTPKVVKCLLNFFRKTALFMTLNFFFSPHQAEN